jgi:Fe-S oxidoreductase
VQVLRGLGLDLEVLDSGCCGMAGSFGYEAGERYDVSVKAGEQVLLPAVRAAAPDTLIVTDGFSCRSQIRHGSRREALHLAQVARLGLRGAETAPHAYPEHAASLG